MLQVFLALGPTVGTFLRRLVRCGYICELSLSQWTISLHFITTVRFGFVCIQNVPFSSWRKHKDGWPLLHCSIISIIRIPRWQNMFTELINVLDLTFIQVYNPLLWNLLRTPWTLYCHCYYQFGYMQITFQSFQGTVSTFYRCGGQSYNLLFLIFQHFCIPTITKISSFFVIMFLKHGVGYDTTRDAILTCARKPTWVSLMYRTELTTKKCNEIWSEKVRCSSNMKPRFRAEWVVVSELFILASCLLRPMSRNSVLEEFSIRRFAVIQEEIRSRALWRRSMLESKSVGRKERRSWVSSA